MPGGVGGRRKAIGKSLRSLAFRRRVVLEDHVRIRDTEKLCTDLHLGHCASCVLSSLIFGLSLEDGGGTAPRN